MREGIFCCLDRVDACACVLSIFDRGTLPLTVCIGSAACRKIWAGLESSFLLSFFYCHSFSSEIPLHIVSAFILPRFYSLMIDDFHLLLTGNKSFLINHVVQVLFWLLQEIPAFLFPVLFLFYYIWCFLGGEPGQVSRKVSRLVVDKALVIFYIYTYILITCFPLIYLY